MDKREGSWKSTNLRKVKSMYLSKNVTLKNTSKPVKEKKQNMTSAVIFHIWVCSSSQPPPNFKICNINFPLILKSRVVHIAAGYINLPLFTYSIRSTALEVHIAVA